MRLASDGEISGGDGDRPAGSSRDPRLDALVLARPYERPCPVSTPYNFPRSGKILTCLEPSDLPRSWLMANYYSTIIPPGMKKRKKIKKIKKIKKSSRGLSALQNEARGSPYVLSRVDLPMYCTPVAGLSAHSELCPDRRSSFLETPDSAHTRQHTHYSVQCAQLDTVSSSAGAEACTQESHSYQSISIYLPSVSYNTQSRPESRQRA